MGSYDDEAEADYLIARAELDRDERKADTEEPDRWGRDPDWNWPRGYGGGESTPW